MVVVDANAALEVVLNRPLGEQLRNVLDESDEIVVPELYINEVANSLWKYKRAGIMSKDQCLASFSASTSFVDTFVSDMELYPEALSEAMLNKHSVYDMLYLVLSRRLGAPLYTRDKKLARICGDRGVECVELVEV